MTFEWTAGLSGWASLGFMQLNARRPGGGLDYAGWRVLPHLYAPRSWHLPVDFGLVAEFSFQKTTYQENSRRLEVRPILEKRVRKFQVAFNPVFERALARTWHPGRMEFRTRDPCRVRTFGALLSQPGVLQRVGIFAHLAACTGTDSPDSSGRRFEAGQESVVEFRYRCRRHPGR